MRLLIISCVSLLMCGCTAFGDNEKAPGVPGNKDCPLSSQPMLKPGCITVCTGAGWQQQCSGMPSMTGGDKCDFGSEPPITKGGCFNTCEGESLQLTVSPVSYNPTFNLPSK